jgi:hypothetical protein
LAASKQYNKGFEFIIVIVVVVVGGGGGGGGAGGGGSSSSCCSSSRVVVVVVVVVHISGIFHSPFLIFSLVSQVYVQETLFSTIFINYL